MPRVTLILPSIRPDLLQDCIRRMTETAGCDDYEIVVVAPFEVRGPRIRWLPEHTRRGVIAAHAEAYASTDSEYVVAMADYLVPHRNWLKNALSFIEERETDGRPLCAGLFLAANERGAGACIGSVFGHYYPYFPAARRRSCEAVGGYFSPDYVAYFADPDLGLRFWANGGHCQLCWDSVLVASHKRAGISPQQAGLTSFLGQDMARFVERWRPRFGPDWPVATMTDFNIDIPAQYIAFDDMTLLPRLFRRVDRTMPDASSAQSSG